ncbi:MAG: hypothetical protein NXI04_05985 [Planctomycetaceae bacterium]|nr:hypothetical protein [Planctomycetaceae bacterium]
MSPTVAFLIFGYLATVAIETPVLCVGMDQQTPVRLRLEAGLLLTAFTYPVVVILLPFVMSGVFSRPVYLLVAEVFAPAAEILFFRFITARKLTAAFDRNDVVIIVANLLSFTAGHFLLAQPLASLTGY